MDHIVLLDDDLIIRYANFPSPGLTLKDVIGKPIYEFLQPFRIDEIKAILRNVFTTGEQSSYETEFNAQDGTIIYYESRVIPLKRPSGVVESLLLTARDITRRKIIEQYQTMIQKSPNYFVTIDKNGKILFANTVGHEKAINFSYGTNIAKYFRNSLEFDEHLQKSILKQKNEEFILSTQENQFFHCYIVPQINTGGELLIILNDITLIRQHQILIKEGEEIFRNAIMESPLPTMIHREDGIILYLNHSWSKITGYSHEEIPTINDWVMKAYGHDNEILEGIAKLFERENAMDEGEFTVTTKQGDIRYLHFYSFPVGNYGGNKLVKSIAIDNTEQKWNELLIKQSEEEKEKLRTQIQQSQKLDSLGLLAGGIAHNFNNFLMGIFGNLSLLQEELEVSHPAFSLIGELFTIAEQTRDLTNQILTFTGKTNLERKIFNVSNYIYEITRFLKMFEFPTTQIDYQLSDEELNIDISQVQLQQVIVNLILNSSQAIQQNRISSGLISVKTRSEILTETSIITKSIFGSTVPGKFVCIEISDNGGGIESKYLDRIFDPFFTTKPNGKGLGLSTLYGIINTRGGGIKIDTILGSGTTFYVYLPLISEIQVVPKQQANPNQHDSDFSSDILIIEDEEYIRNVLSKIISKLGYNPISTRDGESGLKSLQSNPKTTLIILDLSMPRISGLETLKRIRVISQTIPVIISSGYNQQIFIDDETYNDPNTEFLQKPYNLETLKITIEKLIG